MRFHKKLTEQEKKAFNQASINNNKIISEQPEHGIYSSKVYWQKPFYCCEPGCQEKTCLTRRINMSVVAKMLGKEPVDYFQALCETHFRETHAIGMLEIAENGFTGEMNE
jgi:hypothetical protein